MNDFLDDLFIGNGKEEFEKLDTWSQTFWRVDSNNINIRYAQQGYEEKGHSHIERIIANVGELLEKYFENLYAANYNQDTGKETFLKEMKKIFEPNLILFYTVAHLHDIGIGFPGIFKALVKYKKIKDLYPHHIGTLIYEYHHYASFIILMEMSCFDDISYKIEESPYLVNISTEGQNQAVTKLNALNGFLNEIYKKYFPKFKDIMEFQDFKVILAILCLLHKEIKEDYLQNILNKFKEKNTGCVEIFNRWWCFFERSRAWTNKIYQRFSRTNKLNDQTFMDAELLTNKENSIIDLQLVGALLQYGDKTDITIARLARRPFYKKEDPIQEMPLDTFIHDIKYDGRIGYITTKMSQRVISDYARVRACSFIPVLVITVSGVPSNSLSIPELSIVIHYLRFEGDRDMFKYIRFQDEKDFFDLGFLRVIRFHIPMIISHSKESITEALNKILEKKRLQNPVFSLKFKKKEHSIHEDIERKLEKNDKLILNDYPDTQAGLTLLKNTIERKLSDIDSDQFPLNNFPYTAQNCEAIIKSVPSLVKKEGKKQAFYESCDMDVPASFELLAVLNLFHKED